MLTLERLRRLRLMRRPPGQVLFANTVLRWDYRIPRKTEIIIEGIEHIPRDRTVFLAMNHTDNYNYWPLQYEMYRRGLPFTATWVKGKYYEHEAMATFMDACNNIPLPSRGYVIATEYRTLTGDKPSSASYRALRDRVDRRIDADAPMTDLEPKAQTFVRAFCGSLDGAAFIARFDALWLSYLHEILRLTGKALNEVGNNLLLFPEGTRSSRLLRGQTGMMQVAWHLRHDIVPIGCNGSDDCYPDDRPFSRGGRIVYRVGKPLRIDGPELSPHAVDASVIPLTHQAALAHGDAYRAGTDVVMAHLEALLDARYRPDRSATAPEDASALKASKDGIGRFL
jgi:1-acyl-sn-glycerol-3-phosphate acyltransferase